VKTAIEAGKKTTPEVRQPLRLWLSEGVSYQVWEASQQLVEAHAGIWRCTTAICGNVTVGNVLAWSWGSVVVTIVGALSSIGFAYWGTWRLEEAFKKFLVDGTKPDVRPEYDLSSTDPSVTSHGMEELTATYERNVSSLVPSVCFAVVVTSLSIALAAFQADETASKEADVRQAFDDYVKLNLVPAIISFVALGCELVVFAETLSKRAKFLVIMLAWMNHLTQQYEEEESADIPHATSELEQPVERIQQGRANLKILCKDIHNLLSISRTEAPTPYDTYHDTLEQIMKDLHPVFEVYDRLFEAIRHRERDKIESKR
jgi:hypothetical protein